LKARLLPWIAANGVSVRAAAKVAEADVGAPHEADVAVATSGPAATVSEAVLHGVECPVGNLGTGREGFTRRAEPVAEPELSLLPLLPADAAGLFGLFNPKAAPGLNCLSLLPVPLPVAATGPPGSVGG
jgi:hypothetical protein